MEKRCSDSVRHVTSLFDLTREEIRRVLDLSKEIKCDLKAGKRQPILAGHVAALLFEKPSLRTRVSFETAMCQMGGGSLFLGEEVGWGGRESIADFSQVLSSYVDVIICRAKSHRMVEDLVRYSACPVINGLTDLFHPCQALADMLTIEELGVQGKVTYVGDANNVAKSLAVICAKLDVPMAIAAPKGYEFDAGFIAQLELNVPKYQLEQTTDPRKAVKGAVAVYTDVWTSMGQESERELRMKAFQGYQVDEKLLKLASPQARFLHCLPARRGEEVSASVIDSPASAVIQQAENRLHAQKGLLAWLLSGK
jgi:ornithine carbamoyltransferase